MKDVKVLIWCDLCEGQHVDADEVAVAIAGVAGTIDLCEVHLKELMAFREHIFVADKRRSPKVIPAKATTVGDRTYCPVAGCDFSSTRVKNLGGHLNTVHDFSFTKVVAPDLKCPECEREFERPQSLAIHVQRVHSLTIADYYTQPGV